MPKHRHIDITDILASRHQIKENKPPLPEAQAMELRAILAAYNEPADRLFQPGDFVKDKHGLAQLRDHEELVQMFWRWLDPTDPFTEKLVEDALNAGIPRCPDCLVAYQRDGTVLFCARDSSALVRYEIEPVNGAAHD